MPGSLLVSRQVADRWAEAIATSAPGAALVVVDGETVDGDLAAAEIAYLSGDLFPDRMRGFVLALRDAKALRWLHSFSAGVDNPFFAKLRERGVRVTTSSGAHAVPIAQTAIWYLLALSRGAERWRDAQSRKAWERHEIIELEGRTLGVVGLGPIGAEVARIGAALRMRVVGMRRTPRGDEPCETWPLERLDELCAIADALVLALPLAPETHHLVDARRLALLPRGALFVNVGRGSVVDESALVEALASGRLGGAGLDVFEIEPLPAESPLWSMPNVIVTPHNAGDTPGNLQRATEIFLDNLARLRRGDALRNEVP